MSRKRYKILCLTVSVILAILILCCSINIFLSYKALSITEYNISSVGFADEINIAVLSDLHCSQFGKDNERLIRKVKASSPDLIFTVGDMVNKGSEDFTQLRILYPALAEIAPVYSSLGNHETYNPHLDEIKGILQEYSTFLDNEYIEINVKGTDIRLGSLSDYHPSFEDLNAYIRDFADTEKFTLLLSHCPEYYVWGVDEVKIDLMVSGHTHGGQVILPFKGGVYAPEQGYFPKFDYGVFYEENATLVITRGLGSSRQVAPRFNNPPEIVSLTLSPEV